MSSGAERWALVHVDDLTWFVVEYRVWLIILAAVIGLAAPLLGAARRDLPRPAPSLVIRGGAMALAFSAATVAICSMLHFSDLRWLAPDQRKVVHLSAPGGILGFAKPMVVVVNSVAGIPAESQAAQVSVHTAIVCAFRGRSAASLLIRSSRPSAAGRLVRSRGGMGACGERWPAGRPGEGRR